jgi:serine/threonine protein phosphatase 1
MAGRTIAIGDIHGYSTALAALLTAIEPGPEDTIVTLGDSCDRGMDTQGTIAQLIELAYRCRLVPILGNHDEMLLGLRQDTSTLNDWLSFGGTTTLYSYGVQFPADIPAEHLRFLENCLPYFETPTHFFVHASYRESLPLPLQPPETLRWESINRRRPGPHVSGKTAIVGHTAQRNGEILDLGHLRCIDTYCYGGYWLTAMDVGTGQIWQADAEGKVRSKKDE